MKKWAQIIGGQIVNVVVQPTQPQSEGVWQDITGTGLGVGHVDLGDGTFGPPPAPALPRHITELSFRQRFTMAERVGLELASLDDPTAGLPARQQAATLRAYLADAKAARYIDLDRADTRAGVQQLEALGLLAAGRAAIILDAAVQPHERP